MVRDLARAREVETPTDTDLAVRAAAGEMAAFDELYRRHAQSAWRVAQAIAANAEDAADAVAEAFVRVFQALPAGRLTQGVPFRPYLLKATRNAAIDTLRRSQRVRPIGEIGRLDDAAVGAGPSEHVVISEEVALVADAFRNLPERWRSVLWLTEVEGMPARQAAAVLGMSANAVAALALRARAGLRRAYLQAHVGNGVSPSCRHTVDRLGAYVAGALSRRETVKVERHLTGCEECRTRLLELEDLGSTLRRVVLPVPLGLGLAAAGKWHTALAAAVTAPGAAAKTLVSTGARRALSGATAAVLSLGIAAVVVGPGPHRAASAPATREPAAAAPGSEAVTLAGANLGDVESSSSAPAAASAPGEPAATGSGAVPPTSAIPAPATPAPPAPTPPSRSQPAAQVTISGVLGLTGTGVAAGVGPGACTSISLEPSAGGCVDHPRSTAGLTLGASGSLLPDVTVPVP